MKEKFKNSLAKIKGVGRNRKGEGGIGSVVIGVVLVAIAIIILITVFPKINTGINEGSQDVQKGITDITDQLSNINNNIKPNTTN